jgi:hypothetical protein
LEITNLQERPEKINITVEIQKPNIQNMNPITHYPTFSYWFLDGHCIPQDEYYCKTAKKHVNVLLNGDTYSECPKSGHPKFGIIR